MFRHQVTIFRPAQLNRHLRLILEEPSSKDTNLAAFPRGINVIIPLKARLKERFSFFFAGKRANY